MKRKKLLFMLESARRSRTIQKYTKFLIYFRRRSLQHSNARAARRMMNAEPKKDSRAWFV